MSDNRRRYGTNAMLRRRRLLPSFDFLEHFTAHILRVARFKLLFLHLAHVEVVDTEPHNLELLHFFHFPLLFAESLDQTHDVVA